MSEEYVLKDTEEILAEDGEEPAMVTEDTLRFDVAVPFMDSDGKDMQVLTGRLRRAIISAMEAGTDLKFSEAVELLVSDEEMYEPPDYHEQITFTSEERE